ncbi:MAG: ArsJ-associated glyceraldehyde-3-phosphate dehydrogenase [Gammaproteobacteria bacterium]|nr:ArsJ-associated glyceraldehyde-3-phosphate dehydrogenase [Gammaproteobacteria bacterium]
MSTRIAINGFGRMGRLGLRAAWGEPGLDFVYINETAGDAACAAHLLKFDSIHGRFAAEVHAEADAVVVDGKRIGFSGLDTPQEVDWAALGTDLVIECSGQFKTAAALQCYFDQGVRKVVVSAPVKHEALNIVMGINDDLYDPQRHHIVTAASCTTNCLAPVVKVIHEGLGIRHGSMTTIHDITNTQTIIDKGHKDLRRARACGESLIPTTTGSAKAITQIFPELTGKLNGLAVRVPLLNASLTDCVFEVARETSVEQVNALMKSAAEGPLEGILGFESLPLVSCDYKDDIRSSIVDGPSTMVIDGTQVKILAWYDNEIGYANRLMDLVRKVVGSLE